MLLLTGSSAYAQGSSPASTGSRGFLQKGSVEIGGIVGMTLPVTWLRAHSDRSIRMGSLEFGRIMTHQRGPAPLAGQFEFLLEITPLAVIHQPSRVFGVTASPLHMRWNFASIPQHRVRPFAEASGGVILTTQPVPLGTTSFNFIDQAGFGVRFENGTRRSWLVGYRFQHISNAGRVKPNPGANFNFVYAGVSFQR
ncbi:MAG TPA: acyloxyacyl hydrolase [Vicinamibacterales bacterium]|jgi:hypothetical protein|nr:acyloxyacyl hydrolase [Vicinamibacterales bacterium]